MAFVPELRTRSQKFCFRLLAINEESRNDLYSIEIPGIHLKKSSCTLVKTAPRQQVSIHTVQENIALKLSLFSPTYLTRVNPSVASHADVLRGSSRVRQEANLSAQAVINGCPGQLKITIKG